jgi:hypothetical protein
LKQLQEVVGNRLEHIGIWNDFLNRTQKVQHLRERISKWDCIKLKSFCTPKETVTRLKRQPTEWEKIFVSFYMIMDQNLQGTKKFNPQRINILVEKWVHELNRKFSTEEV